MTAILLSRIKIGPFFKYYRGPFFGWHLQQVTILRHDTTSTNKVKCESMSGPSSSNEKNATEKEEFLEWDVSGNSSKKIRSFVKSTVTED